MIVFLMQSWKGQFFFCCNFGIPLNMSIRAFIYGAICSCLLNYSTHAITIAIDKLW